MSLSSKMPGPIKTVQENLSWWKKSKKWKRDNSIVLFGAWFGERFADTSRYLFQYLSDNKDKYSLKHVVWVTRSEIVRDEISSLGYEVYLINSEESKHFHKVAGIHIICNMADTGDLYAGDIMGHYSYGAKRINLWHGVMPIKGVASASNEYKAKKKRHPIYCSVQEFLIGHSKAYRAVFISRGGWGDCYYLGVTKDESAILKKFFLLPDNHFIITGNPRVCGTVTHTEREDKVISILKKYKKVILYLPTFRDLNSSFDYSHVAEPLQDYLAEEEAIWIQKAHTAASSASYGNKQDGNILYLSSDFDTNIIMSNISVLVTDFSSVAADAMFYRKPIIYYMPDYDEYLSKDRGFVIDPETVMMGPKILEMDELKKQLSVFLNQDFVPNQKYLDTSFKYWGPDMSMHEIWTDILRAITK